MSLQNFRSFFLNFSDGDMTGENGNSYRFGKFTLDLSEHRLLESQIPVSLTPKAFEVLSVLVERAGHLVEKDELMNLVWPDSFVEEVNVARIIHTLRKTLGDDGNGNKLIETIPKKGYRFVARVVLEPLSEDTYPSSNGSSATNDARDHLPDEQSSRWSWRHYATGAAIFVVVAMSVLAAYHYLVRPTTVSVPERRTIAVLPFANHTGDPSQDDYADGITENINNNLSELSTLRVIGQDSVLRYKGKDIPSADIARDLQVDSLIKGDIKQVGNELVFNVSLIDAKDGSLLWGNQFQKTPLLIFETPNEITRAVVQRLNLVLTPAESKRLSVLPTEDGDAYRLYLQARKAGQEFSPLGLKKAIEFDQMAIEKDPGFALAYSDMGMRNVNLGIYFEKPDERMPKARKLAEQALALDPSLHEPHIVLGLVSLMYDWNWDKAGDELLEGGLVKLKSIEEFNCTAHVLQMKGKTSDADDALRQALKDNPLSKSLLTELGCNSYYAGKYDESIKQYQDSLEMYPNNFTAVFGLARTFNKIGKYQDAVNEIDSLKSFMPGIPEIGLAERGYANAKMGKREDAENDLRLLEKNSVTRFVDPFLNATVYLGMGDKEDALNFLDKSVSVRSALVPSLVSDGKWDEIREDPHFQEILQKIGFKQKLTASQ